MSDRPLVSCIIIFLNAEKFIEEAIQSVLSQTYANWELLLVDDGSTDGSTEIAQGYAKEDAHRVRYLEHPGHENRGMSSSRNLGIRHTRGELVAFLDADDVWLPHKLQTQLAVLVANPEAGMVYGESRYWFSWTGDIRDRARDYVQDHLIPGNTLYRPPSLLILYLQRRAAVPCTSSILVRREIITQVGGFNESFVGLFEDQGFYAKVCLVSPVFVSKHCWDKYRQHPDASCAVGQETGNDYFAKLFFLNWLAEYLTDQGIADTSLWQALKRDTWLSRHPALAARFRPTRHVFRWTKKWLLFIEEMFLPEGVRSRLWSR